MVQNTKNRRLGLKLRDEMIVGGCKISPPIRAGVQNKIIVNVNDKINKPDCSSNPTHYY